MLPGRAPQEGQIVAVWRAVWACRIHFLRSFRCAYQHSTWTRSITIPSVVAFLACYSRSPKILSPFSSMTSHHFSTWPGRGCRKWGGPSNKNHPIDSHWPPVCIMWELCRTCKNRDITISKSPWSCKGFAGRMDNDSDPYALSERRRGHLIAPYISPTFCRSDE